VTSFRSFEIIGRENKKKIKKIINFVLLHSNKMTNTSTNSTSSSDNRIFAPLNIPLYRRCQTLTIVVWWILPWFCLFLTITLLRSDSWLISGAMLLYLIWMVTLRKHPKQGGHRQQWLRRITWWKWYAG